jgi:hypothetical protein
VYEVGQSVIGYGYNWRPTTSSGDTEVGQVWWKWTPTADVIALPRATYNKSFGDTASINVQSPMIYELQSGSLQNLSATRFIARSDSTYYITAGSNYILNGHLPTCTMSIDLVPHMLLARWPNTTMETATLVGPEVTGQYSFNFNTNYDENMVIQPYWWKSNIPKDAVTVQASTYFSTTGSFELYKTSGSSIEEQRNNLTLVSQSIGVGSMNVVYQFNTGETAYVKCMSTLNGCSLNGSSGNINLYGL